MSLALRLLCTLAPMVVMQVFLNATGPLGFFYGFLSAGCFLPLLPTGYRRPASLVFFGLGACIGLTLIVIQPLSGFLVWFDLVPQGAMRGPVSVVFMYIGGYLSLVASYSLGPGKRLKSIVQLLFVHTLLAFMILHSRWLLVLALIMVPGLVAAALYSRPTPQYKWRGLASLAGLLMMAGLITVASAPRREPAGIILIDEFLSGLLRDGMFRLLPEFPVLYGFSGYGHGFSEDKLGGRPLLSERSLFTVEGQTGTTHYLRTKAYDTFTGTGWALSSGHPARVATGHLSVSGTAAVPAPRTDVDFSAGTGIAGWHTLLSLSLLMDYYPLLPQILGATTVLTPRSSGGLEYKGSPATGLTLASPLVYGERLVVGSQAGSVPSQDTANDPGLYLSVPDSIPPLVLDLAASLHGLTETNIPGALASLLDEGFTYSLDGVDQSGDEYKMGGADFIQNFLVENRTGYCVHFATAAVLLARLAGIPARYVTGFLVSIPQPKDGFLEIGSGGLARAEVSGLNSHAWAELWLPSTGWTSFEATPPMRQEDADAAGSRRTSASLDEYTLRQLAAITGGRIDLRKAVESGPGGIISPAVLATAVLILIIVLLASAGLYRIARQSGWSPGDHAGSWFGIRTGKWAGGPEVVRFRVRARRIVRLASAWGIPAPEHSGWLAWEESVAGLLARHGIDLDELEGTGSSLVRVPECMARGLVIFREVFFGCRQPDSKDFIQLDTLTRYLRALSKRQSMLS